MQDVLHRALTLQPRNAVNDYEEVLRLRSAVKGNEAGIGEAEVELGMGYIWLGKLSRAGDLIESGVVKLEKHGSIPFTIRALRKLSTFYMITLRRKKAIAAFEKAYELAKQHEIQGQVVQLDQMRRYLFMR